MNKLINIGILEYQTFESERKAFVTVEDKSVGKVSAAESISNDVPIPTVGYSHVTEKCNLRCVYCYNKHIRDDASRVLSAKQWRKIMKDMKDYGVGKFVITGGEPLIRQDLLNVYREYRKKIYK